MERFSRTLLRRKRLVGLLVLLGLFLGLAATPLTVSRISEEYAYPGMESFEANQAVLEHYGSGGYQRPYVPVVVLPEGQTVDSPGTREALGRAFGGVATDLEARVASYADTGDRRFVGDDGRTTYALVFTGPTPDGSPPGGGLGEVPDETPQIIEALQRELPPGTTLRVTGLDTLATGVDAGGLNVPLKIAVAAIAAVIVLLVVFRSALAFVPLLISTVAVPVAFLVLLALTTVMEVHDSALTTMPLLGLGIAIDYALLLTIRWREEQAHGHRGDEAVHRAMRTAGHSIVFSSGAVAIGLITMAILPIPFLRSLGIAGMIIAAVSALISLTLLPVILATTGRRLDRRRLEQGGGRGERLIQREADAGRLWTAWSRLMVRFRRPTVLATASLLVVLSIIGLQINLALPVSENLVKSGPGYEGLAALTDAGVPTGVLSAFDVFVPDAADASTIADQIRATEGVHTVVDLLTWREDGTALLTVVPVQESPSPAGAEALTALRDSLPDGVLVGGSAAQTADYVATTYGAFPYLLALIFVVTFIMLARAFRSLLLPLKAIVLNLLSLGAVIGAMVILWQWGWGTEQALGIQPNGTVGTFVPLTIFAFLYGLSMDYEVFILARMREEYDRSGCTAEAVVQGVGRTGRLVTSAALILFFSFVSMASGGEFDVAVFATGMGLGILLDATLIRAILVPATVAMMGRWNWWLPVWAARLLRVEPSPLRDERPESPAEPRLASVGAR
ncbi:MMPL family transporter [Plantactinospora sp. S1510]|uniref:MMPL family transporter n=1 Tax=Plantactinospora alkalitolerans TaxID=2789879 RepID=A0ABS0GPF5_9ACTN|nr:efflux RND transporter permease subunit [Plantactinospora alkalitolerans]MBF9128073.1 MMPL family transporter [Plantactinospora alkalitolerans]